ncbi:Zn finger protein [Elasticomyces elasticus]|uniref:Zn finger protein n=1 Tax=Exophiala sideris TaxID=1016849 RepID=A0ABR0IYS4_9EURO|nr:Zn finger protein [Elasticomyces elasticus]KAK5022514.1 Zn finger protein [Exophiala sideris]KAK5028042.1 Zn finger protein [Exophiala sideris]KAK5051783.1 Zn finger protein [Exophiala sideris]KAK5177885.1 Zn finger protein [Eurotiomycetes sp. CCFEE 6388]
MATNSTTQTYTIPENHFFARQQHSPASSPSPTSPRMQEYLQQHAPNPYKQLRPLKSPLYVPAALRPTEHFYNPSPMTPPKSLHGSLDNLQDNERRSESPEQQVYTESDPYDHMWVQEEELGDVTGPPTKEHWKTKLHQYATRLNAARHSISLFASTIVVIAATSFAPHTAHTPSLWINTPNFTPTEFLQEHAKPAIASISDGTLPDRFDARIARTAKMMAVMRAGRLHLWQDRQVIAE